MVKFIELFYVFLHVDSTIHAVMTLLRKFLILSVLSYSALSLRAQRSYVSNSVLATGNWYKIAVTREGVYRLDIAFLNGLGITGNIPTSQIRIFGNTGSLLPEANSEKPIDDLQEV